MKKSLLVLTLCFINITMYAEFKELKNGWQHYSEQTVLSKDPLNGFYFVKVNDSVKFQMYIRIFDGDTICELSLDAKDQKGNNIIFYTFDHKSTFFFNVFQDDETERFSMIMFEYNEEDEFTTGFNQNGLGQNNLAKQIAFQLLDGHQLKLVVPSKYVTYQEIKELTIPSIK